MNSKCCVQLWGFTSLTCPLYRLINWSIYNIKITPILHTIVSYRLSTSNHNSLDGRTSALPLYLIVFLHQTTTCTASRHLPFHCILSSFYIKPQLVSIQQLVFVNCILSSFYIKPQLPRATSWDWANCILSSFYIKPQLYLSMSFVCSIVSYRLSTSNHNFQVLQFGRNPIVSYRLSTSNHNYVVARVFPCCIVSYRLSTSNHN